MKDQMIESEIEIAARKVYVHVRIGRDTHRFTNDVGADGLAVFLRHRRRVDFFREQRRHEDACPVRFPCIDGLLLIGRKVSAEFYHARHGCRIFPRVSRAGIKVFQNLAVRLRAVATHGDQPVAVFSSEAPAIITPPGSTSPE